MTMPQGNGSMPGDEPSVAVGAGLLLLAAGAATAASGSWLPVIGVSAGILWAKWYLNRY
jgi:hypothetical protein